MYNQPKELSMNPKQQARHDREQQSQSGPKSGQQNQGGKQQDQMGGAKSGESTHASQQSDKTVKTDGISKASQR